jgi:hypothetical protein
VSERERSEARAIAQRVSVLGGSEEIRRRAAARAMVERPPGEASALLKELMQLARGGFVPAQVALPAFTRALEIELASEPYVEELRRVAGLDGTAEIELLLSTGASAQEYDADAAARADAKLFTLPLGHLKTRARLTKNPDELARLAIASDATVVREVLRNSRLTEELVVRIASRRPARPEPLVEIWRSSRWSVRPAVLRALAFNPYLPPEVGAKIVPLLNATDLEELESSAGLHVSIRTLARSLLAPKDDE